MDKPIYQHDCSNCTFLGNYEKNGEKYDLYFCNQSGNLTAIARYGEDGNYTSSMRFAVSSLFRGDLSDPLAVALMRAYKDNLIKVTINEMPKNG